MFECRFLDSNAAKDASTEQRLRGLLCLYEMDTGPEKFRVICNAAEFAELKILHGIYSKTMSRINDFMQNLQK